MREDRKKETQRAREGFVICIILLAAVMWMINSAEASERYWAKPIYYELEPCAVIDAPWETWFEEIIEEISPHTVQFIPSPSHSATNLLVNCAFDNFLESELIHVEDGQEVTYDEQLTLGVTRSRWFTTSQQMIRADIWINELWVKTSGRKIIRHELGHALGISVHFDEIGCDPDCPASLMNKFPSIDYWDFRTLDFLRNRYERPPNTLVDEGKQRYTPCQWVPGKLAALFESEEGFYWSIEENYQGRWEVMEFGPAPACE